MLTPVELNRRRALALGTSVRPRWWISRAVEAGAPFKKFEFARFLDERKIGNRMLFGGNLLRQPVFVNLRKENPAAFRIRGLAAKENASLDSAAIHSLLPGADEIMEQAIFLGVYPGLSQAQLDYVVESVHEFVRRHTGV